MPWAAPLLHRLRCPPATLEVDGQTYEKQPDGSYKSNDHSDPTGKQLTLTEDQALAILERQQAQNEEPEAPTEGNESESNGSETPESETDAEETETPAANGADIPAPATKEDKDGNTWYQHIQDPTIYVKDSNDVNVEITKEMREAYTKAFPGETETEKKFDAKKLAWLALPAALIIGGITWYLTHDGKTYVKDEARKNEQPTAEEKAASEQMLKENKDEVIAQGGKLAEGNSAQGATNGAQSTDNVRGMAAETGNNSIARGAVALAIAGLLAAGAFVARRKFFA